MPVTTIITITFNLIKGGRENTFRQCLESVHNQTYKEIKHIVIDGGSKDGTLDLIREYADIGWIEYISEPDAGIYDAMNKGVKIAKGKYVAFLNSDDFYHNNDGIAISVRALEESGADFSYAPVINLDENEGTRDLLIPDISKIFFSIIPNHQTMLFRRDILIKEGLFNIKYKCVADYELNIRLCLKGYKSIYINEDFSTYRLGGYSLEAAKQGIIFQEVMNIYYENYNKLCYLSRKECEKICGDIFHADDNKIPLKLAKKLKYIKPYFDYAKYSESVDVNSGIEHFSNLFKNNIKKYLKIIIPRRLIPFLRKIHYKLKQKI
jgi:glycosyltransferase involved in cell wall biosynthesis